MNEVNIQDFHSLLFTNRTFMYEVVVKANVLTDHNGR